MHILIVEDSIRMRRVLEAGLIEEGYSVESAGDGSTGLTMAWDGRFDLMLLDLNLPGLDGLDLLRQLRATRSDLPVIVVSARDSVDDRIAGLDAGADDYLVKDFSFSELLARIRAVARRPGARAKPVLTFDNVKLDPSCGRAYRGERPLELSAREYALLQMLLRHAGQVVSRSRLYESVWNISFDNTSNVLDVYVRLLRNKLEAGGESRILHTVRGRGYRLGNDW